MNIKKFPQISIVIPIYNEELYIKTCIKSILLCDYPKENLELFLVDGGSTDNTKTIINNFQSKYTFIQLLDNKEKFAPQGMNIGIKKAKGEYIFILSAHAAYSSTYFSSLVESLQDLNASCVGGVLKTDVKNKNSKSCAIKKVLMHPFGVGNAIFRTGTHGIQSVDTVAFGCYKKETFERYGLFDELLTRNQDIELNKRIINSGGKIYLIPNVECTYYARESFLDLAKNNYSNGYWNILTAYYTHTLSSLSIRHFVPLIFILSLLIPLLLSFISLNFLWISFISLFSYLSLVIIVSFRLRDISTSIYNLMKAFISLHLSYGFGSLVGVSSVLKKYLKGKI